MDLLLVWKEGKIKKIIFYVKDLGFRNYGIQYYKETGEPIYSKWSHEKVLEYTEDEIIDEIEIK